MGSITATSQTPKYAAEICSRLRSAGRPSSDTRPFRHHDGAESDRLGRGAGPDRLTGEADSLGRNGQQAGDGLEKGCLAGAVRADHRHSLARVHPKRDAEERLEIAVERGQLVDG